MSEAEVESRADRSSCLSSKVSVNDSGRTSGKFYLISSLHDFYFSWYEIKQANDLR